MLCLGNTIALSGGKRHNRSMRVLWRVIMALFIIWPATILADNSSSTNYKIEESFVGGGGRIDENSANFNAAESIGDTAVGNSSSSNFQTNSSYTTTSDPALTFIVDNGGVVNFGSLSSTVMAHAISSFRVINYTSYGYQVIIIGTEPARAGHVLPGLASTSTPTVGVEQYGINLVANTGFGANPVQVPDNTFSYGVAHSPDYNVANQYKFVAGDAIASAPKSSGETDYTISHIVNVAALTLGGTYSSNHELICIGTY